MEIGQTALAKKWCEDHELPFDPEKTKLSIDINGTIKSIEITLSNSELLMMAGNKPVPAALNGGSVVVTFNMPVSDM